jgi:hypothetical protein
MIVYLFFFAAEFGLSFAPIQFILLVFIFTPGLRFTYILLVFALHVSACHSFLFLCSSFIVETVLFQLDLWLSH